MKRECKGQASHSPRPSFCVGILKAKIETFQARSTISSETLVSRAATYGRGRCELPALRVTPNIASGWRFFFAANEAKNLAISAAALLQGSCSGPSKKRPIKKSFLRVSSTPLMWMATTRSILQSSRWPSASCSRSRSWTRLVRCRPSASTFARAEALKTLSALIWKRLKGTLPRAPVEK